MTDKAQTIIRPVQMGDKEAWSRLWSDYLKFYKTSLPKEVYGSTFDRLIGDDEHDFHARVAMRGNEMVGLVHYLFHRHCWRIENVCYLQDLFTVPAVRGKGVGRMLIEAVYHEADEAGAPSVYWLTQDDNLAGRKLYDRVGTLTNFIKYQRPA